MLLPWSEEIRVFLAPDRIGLVRLRPGWRGKAADAATTPVQGNAAEAMKTLLGGRRAGVRAYLSGHCTRLLLLPWQAGLESEEEWQAYARHAFDAAFGSSPGRKIRLAAQGYGEPVIAAAIEETLYAGILAAGAAVESVEPYCTAAFDRHRRALPRDCWFFAAEPGMAAAMRIEGGVLVSLSSHPLETDMRASLAATIARELAKHAEGGAEPKVFLHAAAPVGLRAHDLPGVNFTILPAGKDDLPGVAA